MPFFIYKKNPSLFSWTTKSRVYPRHCGDTSNVPIRYLSPAMSRYPEPQRAVLQMAGAQQCFSTEYAIALLSLQSILSSSRHLLNSAVVIFGTLRALFYFCSSFIVSATASQMVMPMAPSMFHTRAPIESP